MKNLLQYIILIVFIISCNHKGKMIFVPTILDSIPQTKTILNSHKMLEGGYELIGINEIGKNFNIKNLEQKKRDYFYKYIKFIDSTDNNQNFNIDDIIEINESPDSTFVPKKPHSVALEDLKYKIGNNNLRVYIDTSQILNMPNYKDNLEINEQIKKGTDNVLEYSNSIKNSYEKYYNPSKNQRQSYPLIISNQSDSIITIQTKEGWLFMIQEAIDKDGVWKPIEYFEPFAFCGNSFGTKYLLPNHYMVSEIYKYTGNFKTKLRLKFTANSKIYYSNEFYGKINFEQFNMPEEINKKDIKKRNVYFFNN